MKMIELLNKIAKGEEVPKKIKYDNLVYAYNEQYDYKNELQINYYSVDNGADFFNNVFCYSLNDEVEILEEEKKIPDDLYCWFVMDYNDDLHEVIKKSNINFRNISEKLDKIIDYLDYLKSKGE